MIFLEDPDVTIRQGEALAELRALDTGIVQTIVTSPPYWGLRDYGESDQLGLEATPELYVERLVAILEEARRVLRDDGTLWLNLGDSYYSDAATQGRNEARSERSTLTKRGSSGRSPALDAQTSSRFRRDVAGLKGKDLIGVPWLVAFALRAAGWYLRAEIIWSKPNPMPESVRDRVTRAHEHVFLLSKSSSYFYDAAAVSEPTKRPGDLGLLRRVSVSEDPRVAAAAPSIAKRQAAGVNSRTAAPERRNARSVWEIATQGYADAHFATFPVELPRRCILAGSAPGDVVLDPFLGSGTTALVAREHGRRAIGVELNVAYCKLAATRLQQQSLFA